MVVGVVPIGSAAYLQAIRRSWWFIHVKWDNQTYNLFFPASGLRRRYENKDEHFNDGYDKIRGKFVKLISEFGS